MLPRKNFSEEIGKEIYLKSLKIQLSIEDLNNKYICMASLSALIKYLENISNINLDKNFLNINYHYLENHLNIPFNSSNELELLHNRKFNTIDESLISLFNCKTLCGWRLLRSNFLQPPALKHEILRRQECVEELINNKDILTNIRQYLFYFKDLDSYITKFSQRINDPTENTIKQILYGINGLRESLKYLKNFSYLIKEKLTSEYFKLMCVSFEDNTLDSILKRIDDFIDDIDFDNLKVGKKQDLILFMVKPKIGNALDVSRKVYSDTINEIYLEFEKLKSSTNDPNIKLFYNETKGFYVNLNENFYIEKDFIVAKKEGKKINCANISLLSFSQRIK